MAAHTGFSVPSSETVSLPDVSANNSSSSDQSTLLSMEQKKLKSPSGYAVACTTEPSGYSGVHKAPQSSAASVSRPVTEQNVQLLSAPQAAAAPRNSHAGSVVSSAEKARRLNRTRLAMELAEARLAHADAEADLESNTGSVGRRLDDVRSDTGSSGPSPPVTAQESPFVGAFSSPVPTFPTTPYTHGGTYYPGHFLRWTRCTHFGCYWKSEGTMRVIGASWNRSGTELYSSCSTVAVDSNVNGASWNDCDWPIIDHSFGGPSRSKGQPGG